MPTCKECDNPITGKGKSGLCRSCSHKTGGHLVNMNRTCALCPNLITDWNETGVCRECWHSKSKNYTNMPKQKPGVKAICWNKHCRKQFNARPDQDLKYSRCPACSAMAGMLNINANGHWL